jgi:hypothetical protein
MARAYEAVPLEGWGAVLVCTVDEDIEMPKVGGIGALEFPNGDVLRMRLETVREQEGSPGGQLPARLPLQLGGGSPRRLGLTLLGVNAPPGDLASSDAPSELPSASSELIRASTPKRWRERALNLVEELAGELAGSTDTEASAAGEAAALGAIRGLRRFVEYGIPVSRRAAWNRLIEAAAAVIPKGKEALELLRALDALKRAYELPELVEGDTAP